MDQEKIWDYHQFKVEAHESVFALSHQRYAFIASQIKPGTHVLNIGIGRGGLEHELLERNCHVYSLDPTKQAVEHIRDTYGLANRAQVGYSQDMPFEDNQFDSLIMSEVLEHLEDDVQQQTFFEAVRVLKPGGIFIGTVPAEEILAASLCVCPCCGNRFHRWGHVRSYNEALLHDLMQPHFKNIRVERHYFTDASKLNWKGRLVRRLKLLQLHLKRYGTNETYYFTGQVP